MTVKTPPSLEAAHLMAHMQALCQEIGPRPATSAQERQAAEYVIQALAGLGLQNIQAQTFKSQSSMGHIVLPAALAATLSMPLSGLGGRWGKLVGGLLLLGSSYTLKNSMRARPPFFQALIAQGESQNVSVSIPPGGEIERRVFLVSHLDSQKQRFVFPPSRPELLKPFGASAIVLTALGGVSLLADALAGRKKLAWWQKLLGAIFLADTLSTLYDETQPHIQGANDNATAVSVLLGLAQALQAAPLQRTEVTLLFTGCEEVGCVGMENYLHSLASSQRDALWIDLEMVGTGDLCYVTRHGISYLTEYAPSPYMAALAEKVARKHPELGVRGKEMLMLEEVSNLRHWERQAICIAGYDAGGWLPNWHRLSDNLTHIEPDTLSRAARYTWALLQEIDDGAGK